MSSYFCENNSKQSCKDTIDGHLLSLREQCWSVWLAYGIDWVIDNSLYTIGIPMYIKHDLWKRATYKFDRGPLKFILPNQF